VATNGSDSSTGTNHDSAFRNLQRAINILTPGCFLNDHCYIYLHEGIHTNNAYITNCYANSARKLVITSWQSTNAVISNSIGTYALKITNDFIVLSNIRFTHDNTADAVEINNANNISMTNVDIYRYSNAILISDSCTNTLIIDCRIYSNINSGLWCTTSDNKYTKILNNNIYSNLVGIVLNGSFFSIVSNNTVYFSGLAINAINSAESNIIINNSIYSNGSGIRVSSTTEYNLVCGNRIFSNSQYGISMEDVNINVISNNFVFKSDDGISFSSGSSTNIVISNYIFSNFQNGIVISGVGSGKNLISYNIITNNPTRGINIHTGNNMSNRIYKNLFINNGWPGAVVLNDSAVDTEIINNVFYSNYLGVKLNDSSSGSTYNNIFMSNITYAISNVSSSSSGLSVACNLFYSNTLGPTNTTNLTFWSDDNITGEDPLINTSFEITSTSSPAFDAGKYISGVTEVYYGSAPDIGWHEFYIASTTPDTTPPSVIIIETNRYFYSNITIHLRASDGASGSGLDRIVYTTDRSLLSSSSPSISSGDGILLTSPTLLQYRAIDTAGNISSNHKAWFHKYDNNPVKELIISKITPNPFDPDNGDLSIEVLKDRLHPDLKLHILDMNGKIQKIISDPSPGLYRSGFIFNGINDKNKTLSPGYYIVLPYINNEPKRKLSKRFYIVN
jgi:parallel beta-helix repeat protein